MGDLCGLNLIFATLEEILLCFRLHYRYRENHTLDANSLFGDFPDLPLS